jgi:hypothetical protein
VIAPTSGDVESYRPPPAQAQAQPAQAQAQAQPRLPPPPMLRPLEVGFGGGLVTLVTRLVKSLMLPITFWEKVWTPPTTEAAKSAPGSEVRPDPEG